MKAIRVHETGDAGHLTYEEMPEPEAGAEEIRVNVAAAGLNFIEIYQRTGLYTLPLPFTPGGEFCGVVDQVGEGVKEFKIGDRVATASGRGAYAEFAIVSAAKACKVPEGISAEIAAALMVQGITAHYLTKSTFPLQPGHTALVHAAASGVGQLLVQIGKMCGARVLGTTSSEEKAKIARDAGADEVILYSKVDFAEEVKRLTDGKGVDVVYDGVGKKTFLKGLDCLKVRGMMVAYGNASGPAEPVDPLLLNRKGALYLTRPGIVYYTQTQEEFQWREKDLFDWLSAGKLKVKVDKTYPLQQAAEAHRYMEAGSTKGKVLLIP